MSVDRIGANGAFVNERGFKSFWKFWSAAWQPTIDTGFLAITGRAAATTLAYAVIGTMLSAVIGFLIAPLIAQRLWQASGHASARRRTIVGVLRRALRTLVAIPRSVHEVVFALLLVQIYGTDPIVAILAIGVPFGAVSAAVFADAIDDAAPEIHEVLRASGAGRLAALTYSVGPAVAADVTSYLFYRFECAIRTAAILGVIGAGGLGYQIQLSFQTLRYSEMWTLIYALIVISGSADLWSAAIRRRQSQPLGQQRQPRFSFLRRDDQKSSTSHPLRYDPVLRGSVAVFIAAVPVAWWWIKLNPSVLFDDRRRSLASELVRDMFPPRYGPGGFSALFNAAADTAAMSIVAIAVSAVVGLAFATMSARPISAATPVVRNARLVIAARRTAVRAAMLSARAIPLHVWAFLAALVLFPGAWPGVAALAVYNTGIMARLFAETLEDVAPETQESLIAQGARPGARYLYATLPAAAARLVALSTYRWEVIMRETVVVGVVGAAGLGRLIQDDLVARDFAAVTSTIAMLVVMTFATSGISRRLRQSL